MEDTRIEMERRREEGREQGRERRRKGGREKEKKGGRKMMLRILNLHT